MTTTLIHHGDNNHTRNRVSCGALKTLDNHSVAINNVDCIDCIIVLLAKQKYETGKTEKWKQRLAFLKQIPLHLRSDFTVSSI